jgi:peroxiredoxin
MNVENQKAESVNLAEIIGIKPTVLFFYPKDNTAGCTKEVNMRNDHQCIMHIGRARALTTIVYLGVPIPRPI